MNNFNFSRHFLPEVGLYLYHLPTDKFKTNTLKCIMPLPLEAEKASANALLPFVLYRGSAEYPESMALIRRLEELFGTDLAVDVRKRGEWQLIDFTLETVKNSFLPMKEDIFPAALDILQGIIFDPFLPGGSFKQQYLESEKRTLEEEIINLKNNKMEYALERCFQEMCQGEPFSIFRYGNREALQKITGEQLMQHYLEVRNQAPLYLFFVGNIGAEKIIEWIREKFPPRENIYSIEPNGVFIPNRPEKIVVEKDIISQGKLNIGFRTGINRQSPDFATLLVANGLLAGFPHSRLFRKVREEQGLAYYIFSRVESTKGLMTVSAGIDGEQLEETLDIIEGEWAKIVNGKIKSEELSFTKKALGSQLKIIEDDALELIGVELINAINSLQQNRRELMEQIEKVEKNDVARVMSEVKKDTLFFLEPDEEGS